MNSNVALPGNHSDGSIIDEHGFTAMLRGTQAAPAVAGILGAPRIDPTRSGLWIEDSYAVAVHTVIMAILEDFVQNEELESVPDVTGQASPRSRKKKQPKARCATNDLMSAPPTGSRKAREREMVAA